VLRGSPTAAFKLSPISSFCQTFRVAKAVRLGECRAAFEHDLRANAFGVCREGNRFSEKIVLKQENGDAATAIWL
jgi:hypothetical protein